MDMLTIINELAKGNNPPLYELFLHGWVKLGGTDPFWVRLPSVIFSSMTAVMIYNLGRRFINREVAIVGSLIFTFSTFIIYFSHEARVYSLFALLATISVYYFLRLTTDPKEKNNWTYLLIFNMLLVYAHYFGIIIIGLEIIYAFVFLWKEKEALRTVTTNVLFLLVIFLPGIIIGFRQARKIAFEGSWLSKPTIPAFYDNVHKFSNKPVIAAFFIILILTLVVRICIGYKAEKPDGLKAVKFLLVWFFVPYISIFIVSFWIPMFLDRYLMFLTVPFYLLVAVSVSVLAHKIPWLRYSLFSLIIAGMIYTVKPNPSNNREVIKVTNLVKENKSTGTLVLITPYWCDLGFLYYYNQDMFHDYLGYQNLMSKDSVFATNDLNWVKQLTAKSESNVIYYQNGSGGVDPDDNIKNYLSSKYSHTQELYRKDPIVLTKFSD